MIWSGILADHLFTHSHIWIYKIIYIAKETSNRICEREQQSSNSLYHRAWQQHSHRSFSNEISNLHSLHLPLPFTHHPINGLLSCSPAEPFLPGQLQHSFNPSAPHTLVQDSHCCTIVLDAFSSPNTLPLQHVLQHLQRGYASPDPSRPAHTLDSLDRNCSQAFKTTPCLHHTEIFTMSTLLCFNRFVLASASSAGLAIVWQQHCTCPCDGCLAQPISSSNLKDFMALNIPSLNLLPKSRFWIVSTTTKQRFW